VSFAREGLLFIVIAALIAAGTFALALNRRSWPLWLAAILLVVVALWVAYFFRDPERTGERGENLVIAPADGRVVQIVPVAETSFVKDKAIQVSIFMNVFNVHVNRNPISGSVVALSYRAGKFFNASFDKASIYNERMSIRLRPEGQTGEARDLAVVQIAGLVARRIVCDLRQGEGVRRGERFGIIRFGSRVDVFLPPGAEILVQPGMITRAGETVLARFV
jgi:phosphatidylserine decarboxylase